MAISPLGGAVNTTTSNVNTLSVNYSPTLGNTVTVAIGTNSEGAAATGVSVQDNLSNNLTVGPTVTSSGVIYVCSQFYYSVPSGVTSFTASWTNATSSGGVTLFVEEYSGVGSVNPAGVSNSGVSAPATISLVSTVNNSFAVGILYYAISTNLGALTSGSQRQVSPNTSKLRSRLADQTAASSGSTLTLTNTTSGNTNWASTAIELLPPIPPSAFSRMGPTPRGFNGIPWQSK